VLNFKTAPILLQGLLNKWRLLLIFSIFFFYNSGAWATHIKAGEITIASSGSGSTIFDITLTLYLDSTSVANSNGQLDENTALISFGDGSDAIVPALPAQSIGNNTIKKVYHVTHDFKVLGGQPYVISYRQTNRNKYIVNIDGKSGANSDQEAFYIESALFTDPFIGAISSPIMANPPIDNATPDQIFTHNPGAIPGSKGDSISYEIVIPKTDRIFNVPQYVDPADPQFNGQSVSGAPATFTLNPYTGELVWDTPANYFPPGINYALYNVAIRITQWRKRSDGTSVRISYVVRDMQIQVRRIPNKRPELKIPKDTCLIAGDLYRDTIYASDPDRPKQLIILTATSEILLPANLNPSFKLNTPVNLARSVISNPGTATLTWTPGCRDVRDQPYYFVFEAQDNVGYDIRLATYKTLTMTVYGPKPQGLTATPAGPRAFNLKWDLYTCASTGSDSILIYRKDCNPDTFRIEPCKPLSVLQQGFRQIASVSSKETTYLDNQGLLDGAYYCYIIIARFPGRGGRTQYAGGLSFPSDEVCKSTFEESAIITNVSVDKTDSVTGAITINWLNDITPVANAAFEYRLYRGTGLIAQDFKQVFSSTKLEDSTFTDSIPLLNTRDTTYTYHLEVFKNNALLSSTDTASSVYLNVASGLESFKLDWKYRVPWDNQVYNHYIYRKKQSDSTFMLIDSVQASTDSMAFYTDNKVTANDTFCYYVETRGKYCFDSLPGLLINKSEISCQTAQSPPCPPILSLVDENCAIPTDSLILKPYNNYLSWSLEDTSCYIDLKGFNLYFAPQEEENYTFLKFINKDSLQYVHQDYSSQAGCYYITSINNHRLESGKSNIECNDNCFYYELPNLITPNHDNLNETFSAMKYPRGVENVELFVYNRWGALVHYQNDNINLNWDPTTPIVLSDGIYYYTAKIKFERRLKRQQQGTQLKGWVEILGSESSPKTTK
jgi:gliding motility-associated-like protein